MHSPNSRSELTTLKEAASFKADDEMCKTMGRAKATLDSWSVCLVDKKGE